MRVPFGSSNTSARSCGQNSPSMPPSGVTFTLAARAGWARIAAAAMQIIGIFFIGASPRWLLEVYLGAALQLQHRARLVGARHLEPEALDDLASRAHLLRIGLRKL